jgi:hypothetical protein
MAGVRLSVVVVAHDMQRELPRTLSALGASYQRVLEPGSYEVVVVDNGSDPPVQLERDADAPTVRVVLIEDAPPSPAHAINVGLAEARGDVIGVMTDGAHLVSPGMLHFALAGVALAERAVVTAPAWNLGWDSSQTLALESGYDLVREDALLARIAWPGDGYRLFEIAAPTGASVDGWLGLSDEADALFMRRELWRELGGAEERFDLPGGGYVNRDLMRRALELPDTTAVTLLGEGTFHQLHGDLAARSSRQLARDRIVAAHRQYIELRRRPWATPVPTGERIFVGTLPAPALELFKQTTVERVSGERVAPDTGLGPSLSPTVRALLDLARGELGAGRFAGAAAVSRVVRQRFGDLPEAMAILSQTSRWHGLQALDDRTEAQVKVAVGEAHAHLGDTPHALDAYREALERVPNSVQAHLGRARLRMPGPDYQWYLARMHRELKPAAYLEIGVAKGTTLRLARPPTVAIGVDPEPSVTSPMTTETHIFPVTSDAFFADRRLASIANCPAIELAFVDGLHHFEQALRDFANIESVASRDAVVLLHDTLPLDEITQGRERETDYWTGDVWKVVVCLKAVRPDLDIFTIATSWAGLTVVTGLNPDSHILRDEHDRLVEQYIQLKYRDFVDRMNDVLEVVANDWDLVESRIAAGRRVTAPARRDPAEPNKPLAT